MERAARVGMHLHADSAIRFRLFQPEIVKPVAVEREPTPMGMMLRMYHVPDFVGRMPATCPQHLALSAAVAAFTKAREGSRHDIASQSIDSHDYPPFTVLGRSNRCVCAFTPAAFSVSASGSSTLASVNSASVC